MGWISDSIVGRLLQNCNQLLAGNVPVDECLDGAKDIVDRRGQIEYLKGDGNLGLGIDCGTILKGSDDGGYSLKESTGPGMTG